MTIQLEAFTTLCEGTHCPVAIAFALLPYVRKCLGENSATERDLQSVIDAGAQDCDAFESIIEATIELEAFAPAHCSIHMHEGDGALLGVWPDVESALNDEDVLRVSDLYDVPDSYSGLALLVNDHGNATLYDVRTGGAFREIWGVV